MKSNQLQVLINLNFRFQPTRKTTEEEILLIYKDQLSRLTIMPTKVSNLFSVGLARIQDQLTEEFRSLQLENL